MAGDERDVCALGFDVTVAHPARVYNYLLGGKDNFEADREAARQMIAGGAKVRAGVRANRAFLGRAVRFLTGEVGIRSPEQIAAFFSGLEMVEPGLVQLPQWRPDLGYTGPVEGISLSAYCGIGRKP